jgi:hypothetical protein
MEEEYATDTSTSEEGQVTDRAGAAAGRQKETVHKLQSNLSMSLLGFPDV